MNETIDNKSRSLEDLNAIKKLISDKKGEIKKWNDAIPTLNRGEEEINWAIIGISALPTEEIDNDITERIENQHNYWTIAIQDSSNLYSTDTSANAINASGSSRIYNKLEDYNKKLTTYIGVSQEQEQIPQITLQYQQIQKKQKVEEDIYNKLKSIMQIPPAINKKSLEFMFYLKTPCQLLNIPRVELTI